MAFGFGGLGASFPMRFGGAPLSQPVQSIDEMQKPVWDEYNAAMARQSAAQSSQNAGLDALTADRLAGRGLGADVVARAQGLMRSAAFLGNSSGNTGAVQSAFATANDPMQAASQYSAVMGGGPSYGDFKARADALTAPYVQNQTAQQQAYNGMLGNGQLNGVLGANYSAPGFGQVKGQTSNPFGTPTNPGVDMSWSSGVYNPSGNSQTGVYNPTANSYKQWGL